MGFNNNYTMKLVTLAFSAGLTSVYSFPHPTEPVPVPLIETEAPEWTEPTTDLLMVDPTDPTSEDPATAHSVPKCELSESHCHYFSDLKMYCDSRIECCERGPQGPMGAPGIDGLPGMPGTCICDSGPPGTRPSCQNIPARAGEDGSPGFPGAFGPQIGCVWIGADGRERGGLGPPGRQGHPGPPGHPAPPGMPGPADCGWFPNDNGPPGMPSVGGPPSDNGSPSFGGPPSLAYKPTEEPLITEYTTDDY